MSRWSRPSAHRGRRDRGSKAQRTIECHSCGMPLKATEAAWSSPVAGPDWTIPPLPYCSGIPACRRDLENELSDATPKSRMDPTDFSNYHEPLTVAGIKARLEAEDFPWSDR